MIIVCYEGPCMPPVENTGKAAWKFWIRVCRVTLTTCVKRMFPKEVWDLSCVRGCA
jgi:hypothetical protein